MLSYIYRSEKKADCYIYINQPKESADLPGIVEKTLGDLTFVMELEITEESKLAQVEAEQVLAAMRHQGFYIQMPPKGQHPVDALFEKLFD